jgi:hypothetical protein
MSPILGARGGLAASAYGFTSFSVGDYESIATANGTGSSTTITFSSIPSTYKHLQIRGILKNTSSGQFDDPTWITFNADTGSNYSYHSLYGTGTVATALSGVSQNNIVSKGTPSGSSGSNKGFCGTIVDILDYTDTNKYKTLRWLQGFDNNGQGSSNNGEGSINLTSGNWRSTSAITSISFIGSSFNWTTDATLTLYGIK